MNKDLLIKLAFFSIIIQVVFNFAGVWMVSKQSEKIAALEDVIFVHGIYREMDNGAQRR